MDNYQEMEYLNRLWAGGEAPWKIWKDKAHEDTATSSAAERSARKSR